MALPKAASIVLGVAMVGAGAYQFMHGMEACQGGKLHWGSTHATSFDIGDFTVAIPAGWRDASEATDEKMKDLLAKQPGARVLVREDFDGQTVFIKSGPTEPVGATPPCNEIATELGKAEGSTPSNITQQAYGGDVGCKWTVARDKLQMTYNMRFHGAQIFLVACSGTGALCEPVLAGVTAKK